ncbi:hypothetical protein YC2023_069831 [Brassica napus]
MATKRKNKDQKKVHVASTDVLSPVSTFNKKLMMGPQGPAISRCLAHIREETLNISGIAAAFGTAPTTAMVDQAPNQPAVPAVTQVAAAAAPAVEALQTHLNSYTSKK